MSVIVLIPVLLLLVSLAAVVGALVGYLAGPVTPRARRAVIAQYAPPPGTSILVAAALVNRRGRSVSAQIVDLAVRRALAIRRPTVEGRPFTLEALDWSLLDEVESELFHAVFGPAPRRGDLVQVNQLNGDLVRRLARAQSRADRQLRARSLVDGPRGRWRVLMPVLQFVVVLSAVVLTAWANAAADAAGSGSADRAATMVAALSAVVMVVCGVLFVATIVLSVGRYRAVTATGVDLRDEVNGLRLFISLAEADRLRMLQSPTGALSRGDVLQLTERLLGWAVLFGLEREWARVLALHGGDQGPGSLDVPVIFAFSDSFIGVAPDGNAADAADSADSADGSYSGDYGSATSDGGGGGGGDGGGDGGGGGGGD